MQQVLFVGSFKSKAKDGSLGGQMFACRTIITSELNTEIVWTLIDTTSDSNILATFPKRLYKAMKRLFLFCFYILSKRFTAILIFTADGYSFWEKGLMAILGKKLTKSKVILAPRSGLIINDIKADGKLAKFIPKVFNEVDTVICQSSKWKEYFWELDKSNNIEKFEVIENWIDNKSYDNLPLRQPESSVNILFLSWVDKNKGIYELLEAAKRLKDEKYKFKVFIAGHGTAYEWAKYTIDTGGLAPEVNLLGWLYQEEKIRMLVETDIYVLPSYFEGYPNSLVEAMAAGKACIATKVGSIPDLIEHGISGLLIEKEDANDIYMKLRELIENSDMRMQLGVNARERIRKNNTINITITKLRKVLLS